MSTNQLFSYWEQQTFLGHYDVVVVGGGIVGLAAAIFTRQLRPAARVCVLERGMLPTGASTKNAGFACFGSVSELLAQEQKGGTDALLEVVRARWEGLRLLRSLLGDGTINYEGVGGYELFRPQDRLLAERCREHLGYYNQLLAPVIGTSRIFSDATPRLGTLGLAGVETILANAAEGSLHTGRMMEALLRRAWQEGVLVMHGCQVTGVESHSAEALVQTTLGPIKAGQVLLATNAFTQQFFPALDVVPGRGQVLVTEPINGLQLRGTFHYNEGYYYFRNVGNRVLLGGGRNLDFAAEATTEPGLTSLVQEQLEHLLTTVILPGQRPRIDYRWSGVMAFGEELEPIIKEVEPRVFVAARCNGMGVAMGTGSGQRAALLMCECG